MTCIEKWVTIKGFGCRDCGDISQISKGIKGSSTGQVMNEGQRAVHLEKHSATLACGCWVYSMHCSEVHKLLDKVWAGREAGVKDQELPFSDALADSCS